MVVAKNSSAHTVQRRRECPGRAREGLMEAQIIARRNLHRPALKSAFRKGGDGADCASNGGADGTVLVDSADVRDRHSVEARARSGECVRLLHRQSGGGTTRRGHRGASPGGGGESAGESRLYA